MLSRRLHKHIKSLQIKKYRLEHQAFLVEGKKNVAEILNSNIKIESIFCTQSFFDEYKAQITNSIELEVCTEQDLQDAGSLESNNAAIAICKLPERLVFDEKKVNNELILVLDFIQDPGNLGTIIRTADWYGINHIICTSNTTDCFSPKVIVSTMGSFARVNVYYQDIKEVLANTKLPIYGAILGGENVHNSKLQKPSFLVIGNESKGISADVLNLISMPITIPGSGRAESLNAGIATAILLDAFYRI
ncbi:MAG: hypothetical protein RLZZ175_810 [Bacteroidota bacterium]|jgi:TrmH family RNA methyltransferase